MAVFQASHRLFLVNLRITAGRLMTDDGFIRLADCFRIIKARSDVLTEDALPFQKDFTSVRVDFNHGHFLFT